MDKTAIEGNRLLRPCDCVTTTDVENLTEQGIKHNDQGIHINEAANVVITMGHTTLTIHKGRFKMFAEWYLHPQEIDNQNK